MFKIGDKIQFKKGDEHQQGNPDIYTIFRISHGYSAPLIYFIYPNGFRSGGYYEHRFILAETQAPRDKYQEILNKIKYLDNRFKEHKHVTV